MLKLSGKVDLGSASQIYRPHHPGTPMGPVRKVVEADPTGVGGMQTLMSKKR